MWEPSDWIALAALVVAAGSIYFASRNISARIEADKDIAQSQRLEDRRTRYIEDAYTRLPELASLLQRVSWDSDILVRPPEPSLFEVWMNWTRPVWEQSAQLVGHVKWFQQFGWTKEILEAADEIADQLETIYTSIHDRRWIVVKRLHPAFGSKDDPLTDDEGSLFGTEELKLTKAVEAAERGLKRLSELIREP